MNNNPERNKSLKDSENIFFKNLSEVLNASHRRGIPG